MVGVVGSRQYDEGRNALAAILNFTKFILHLLRISSKALWSPILGFHTVFIYRTQGYYIDWSCIARSEVVKDDECWSDMMLFLSDDVPSNLIRWQLELLNFILRVSPHFIQAGSSVLWSKQIGSLQQGAYGKGILWRSYANIHDRPAPHFISTMFLLHIYQIIISRVLLHFCGSRFTLPEDSWVGFTIF